jgi:hypothetical protein
LTIEKAVTEAVAARGIETASDPTACAADPAALAPLLRKHAAQGAVRGTVATKALGTVRGTNLPLAHSTVRLEIVEAEGRVSAAATGEGDAWGATLAEATDKAARAALDGALRDLGPHVGAKWPVAASSDAGVVLHVVGVTRWADLQTLTRLLANTAGVGSVEPRRFTSAGVDVLVHTALPASALAAALARAPADGVRFAVEPAGDLEARVRIVPPDPAAPPAPAPGPAPAPTTSSPGAPR